MKKIVFAVLITIIFSCKNEEKKAQENIQDGVTQEDDTKNIQDSKPKDLTKLLYESFEEGKEINKTLGGLYSMTKASVIIDPDSDDNIYISFLLGREIIEEEFKDYELQLNVFPYAEEVSLLREDTKKKDRDYDSWYFKPKIASVNGVSFLYKKLDTPISDFRQIYVHLYDVNTKKIIQESIVIKNLELQ